MITRSRVPSWRVADVVIDGDGNRDDVGLPVQFEEGDYVTVGSG